MPLVELEGARLYYEEAGSGPAVVMAHGGGGDLSQWRHQISAFSDRYRVVAFDARGHGRSISGAGAWAIDDFVGDLKRLLARLDIDAAHLVGATLGGVVALEFALAYPEAVRSLVLVSTAPDTTDEMRARFDASAEIVEKGDVAAFAEGFIGFIFSPGYAADHPDEVADFRGRLERIDPRGYARSIRALGHRPDLTPRLEGVNAPALVVTGALDPIPTSAPGAEQLCRALPNARAEVIAAAAHLPHIEQPEVFNRAALRLFETAAREAA